MKEIESGKNRESKNEKIIVCVRELIDMKKVNMKFKKASLLMFTPKITINSPSHFII